jgi:hypothetical protein
MSLSAILACFARTSLETGIPFPKWNACLDDHPICIRNNAVPVREGRINAKIFRLEPTYAAICREADEVEMYPPHAEAEIYPQHACRGSRKVEQAELDVMWDSSACFHDLRSSNECKFASNKCSIGVDKM